MAKGTIVITGSNGFIGKNLIKEAIQQKWNIKGIVRRQEAAEIVKKLGGEPIIIKDLDISLYKHAFEGSNAVIHLVGVINEQETSFHEAHVDSTRIVLEAAVSEEVDRVINVSGLGVDQYGKMEWANNPYFKSKLDAEHLLTEFAVPFVNFRPSYIFGPESYWFASLFRGIQKGNINMIGDGLIPMQPVFVKDVVRSFLSSAAGMGYDNMHYDMVGPEVTNMLDIVQRVIRYYKTINKFKGRVEINHIPYSEAPKRLSISKEKAAVSQCDMLGDNSRLIKDLSIKLTPLNQAIKISIQNFTLE